MRLQARRQHAGLDRPSIEATGRMQLTMARGRCGDRRIGKHRGEFKLRHALTVALRLSKYALQASTRANGAAHKPATSIFEAKTEEADQVGFMPVHIF
jgi:hypothetical protein